MQHGRRIPRLVALRLPDQRAVGLLQRDDRRARPPGVTRMRSLSTSGDSLRPQWMLEPPNFSQQVLRPEHLAGRRVERPSGRRSRRTRRPVAVDRRRAARPVCRDRCRSAARSRPPTAACRSRRRTPSRIRCPAARRACTAARRRPQTTNSLRRRRRSATPAAVRAGQFLSRPVLGRDAVAARTAPLGPVVERAASTPAAVTVMSMVTKVSKAVSHELFTPRDHATFLKGICHCAWRLRPAL